MIVSHDEHLITAVGLPPPLTFPNSHTLSLCPTRKYRNSVWHALIYQMGLSADQNQTKPRPSSQVCDELWIIRDKRVILSEGDFEEYSKAISNAVGTGH